MTTMKRIGLLGGSFDPIHAGHLQLARDAIDALGLDELRLVVAAQPWQKPGVSPAVHRLRMVELALETLPPDLRARLSIERCELERSGPSYTIDTVIALRAALGPAPCLALVMGSDQWQNLGTWHRHAELTDYASIAVAYRADAPGVPGVPPIAPPGMPAAVPPDLAPDQPVSDAARVAPPARALPPPGTLCAPCGQTLSFAMTPHPASATALRTVLRSGQDIGADLLAPAVLAYSRAQHLYEKNPA